MGVVGIPTAAKVQEPHTASPPSQVNRCDVHPEGFVPFSFIIKEIYSGSKRNRQVLDYVLASIRRFQCFFFFFFFFTYFLNITNVDNVISADVSLKPDLKIRFGICIEVVSFFISEEISECNRSFGKQYKEETSCVYRDKVVEFSTLLVWWYSFIGSVQFPS